MIAPRQQQKKLRKKEKIKKAYTSWIKGALDWLKINVDLAANH